MPDLLGAAGHWMLLAAAVVAAAAIALPVPRLLRVRRRSRALRGEMIEAEARMEASLVQLRAGSEERERLLARWRTAWKWARHPLTIALLRSYWRRFRAA